MLYTVKTRLDGIWKSRSFEVTLESALKITNSTDGEIAILYYNQKEVYRIDKRNIIQKIIDFIFRR